MYVKNLILSPAEILAFLIRHFQDESQWVVDSKIRDESNQSQIVQCPQRTNVSERSSKKEQGIVIASPCYLLTSRTLALAQRLGKLLEEDMDHGQKIQSLGSFMFHIPSRLGDCQALDDATECISSTYISILQPACQRDQQDRRQYFTALKSLRRCILDERQALSSNVLAAAVLLSWYEVCEAHALHERWYSDTVRF
jgi:hypothetical protein